MSRLMRDSKLSWATVCRARRGEMVGAGAAWRLSAATGGKVPARDLTNEHEALAAFEALALESSVAR